MLLVIASHLPGESAEAIIDLATGTTPAKPEVRKPAQGNPYEHPNAQRRFRVLTGTEELARALDYPWERWIVFLRPSQADWVSRSFDGPTRIQGSAGTRKTVVAECQDITAALFFAGDLGQRIFQQPFSWTQYGVDIRSHSRTLSINSTPGTPHDPRRLDRPDRQFATAGGLKVCAPCIDPRLAAPSDSGVSTSLPRGADWPQRHLSPMTVPPLQAVKR